MKLRRERGQSTVEYMLAISVIVIGLAAGFYSLVGNGSPGPISKSFEHARKTVEAPYP